MKKRWLRVLVALLTTALLVSVLVQVYAYVEKQDCIQKGLSQESLASKAGMARSHYAMIESGAKRPDIETLWRIANALEIRLSDIIRMTEDR